MRALCGAIITAGALLGLGLLSIGAGYRYAGYPYRDGKGNAQFVYFRDLDTLLTASFVVLIIVLVIGLAVTFLGLAYHHHRRHWEMHGRSTLPGGAPPAAGTTTSGERVSV